MAAIRGVPRTAVCLSLIMNDVTSVSTCLWDVCVPSLKKRFGAFLAVQWLRLGAPDAGGTGRTPDQGTGSHRLQLRVHVPPSKDPASRRANPSGHNKDPEQPNKFEIKEGNVYSDSSHVF